MKANDILLWACLIGTLIWLCAGHTMAALVWVVMCWVAWKINDDYDA